MRKIGRRFKTLPPIHVSSVSVAFLLYSSAFFSPEIFLVISSGLYRLCRERERENIESSHLHNHLLSAQERVADELASPQGNGSVSHDVGA